MENRYLYIVVVNFAKGTRAVGADLCRQLFTATGYLTKQADKYLWLGTSSLVAGAIVLTWTLPFTISALLRPFTEPSCKFQLQA